MIGLKIPYLSRGQFYRTLKVNLYPVIIKKWTSMRDSLISSLGSEKCDIAGDGQFDSPGFSAKYCKYSIMNINTGAILDFFVAQQGMYSEDLETVSCKEVLANLIQKGLNIHRFVTDENSKVSKMVVDTYSTIIHCLDVWHKARLIKKKLKKIASIKGNEEIACYINKIVNHFWYSCQTCGGDAETLLQRFQSCLLHLCNKHAWSVDPLKFLKDRLHMEKMSKKVKQTKRKGNGVPDTSLRYENVHMVHAYNIVVFVE